MALQSSGAISLDDIHVEAGGTTGTTVSINDTDVRDLISSTPGTQVSFDDYYGASSFTLVDDLNAQTTLTVTQGIATFSSFEYFGYHQDGSAGSISPTTVGANSLIVDGSSGSLITARRRDVSGEVGDDSTSDFFLMIGDNAAGTHGAATTYITGVTIDVNGGTLTLPSSSATIFRNNTTGTTRWIWLTSVFSAQELIDFYTAWDGSGNLSVVLNT